jgi:nicotinate-nucleotide adenylyltransferase
VRTGVLGGTFDPIHLGHLLIAEEARLSLGLDDVLFIAAGQPYFKTGQPVSEACHRLAMVELAVASNPHFTASDVEIARPGPTYTVDTLTELRKRLGEDCDLFLILGMDSLADLDRWRRPEDIVALSTVVGFARPGADVLDDETRGCIQLLDGPQVDVSGSDIRRRVAAGLSIRYMVPEPVEEYIYVHRLYEGSAEEKREAV